jgi:hypothetical protein
MSWKGRPVVVRFIAIVLGTALGIIACAPASPNPPFTANGQEQMPIFASIWVTSEPVVPTVPVDVRLTQADDPGFERAHTFVAGAALRGSIPLSSGRYHIEGLDGACGIDVFAGPERETDVLLQLDDGGGCVLTIAGEHGIGDGNVVDHGEPSILVAPSS